MTNRLNKIHKLPNREEVYKYGMDKGFGRALGMCIKFLRENFTDDLWLEEELKKFVLERKRT